MFHNYIKTAIRRLLRNKSISAINIIGLSLGMAVTFVILIFVFHELSYDKYHKKRERIYRVLQENRRVDMTMPHTPYPMADALKEEYPRIEQTARVFELFNTQVRKGQRFIAESNFFCADDEVFEILTFPLIKGDPGEILNEPNDVVLTKAMALKYFGSLNIMDKELVIRNAGDIIRLNISGVMENVPVNSTFKPEFIASIDLSLRRYNQLIKSSNKEKFDPGYLKKTWDVGFFTTYVLTEVPIDPSAFEDKFRGLEKKYLDESSQKQYHLQAMEDIYFHSGDIFSSYSLKGDLTEVYIFGVIAFLVLIIACINYILLSTSQAVNRSYEVGIRKIAGAGRKYLFRQVLTESFLITLIAFPLSLILIEQLRPLLISFIEKDFIQYGELDWKMLISCAGVIFILSYLPGIFTMRYYSGISPVIALSRNYSPVSSGLRVQKLLIALQFVIFLVLVSTSLGIYKQIHFTRNHELGFDPDHIIILPISGDPSLKASFPGFKDALISHNQIKYVSAAMWVPPTRSKMGMEISKPGNPGEKISLEGLYVEKDFIETMGIQLLRGRSFAEYGEDPEELVLLNETAVKKLGIDDPLGVELWPGKIIGVIRDFHYHSFRREIPPMMLIAGSHMTRHALIKTTGKNTKSIIHFIRDQYRNFSEIGDFSYSFMDEHFDEIYKAEKKLVRLVAIFSVIAIVIASMGLLGLTIFTTKRRTKEIAIRKVHGARIGNVMGLLSGKYLKLILVAALMAVPLAYWVLQKWLQNFAYQTEIPWWIFVISVLIAMFITLFTVSFQTYRVALVNPAHSLRYE
jgi:putative ABC transport system permease protein